MDIFEGKERRTLIHELHKLQLRTFNERKHLTLQKKA